MFGITQRVTADKRTLWNANTVISHFISLHVVHSSLYGLLTSLSEVISLLCVVHSLLYVGLTSLHEVHLTIYEVRTFLYAAQVTVYEVLITL